MASPYRLAWTAIRMLIASATIALIMAICSLVYPRRLADMIDMTMGFLSMSLGFAVLAYSFIGLNIKVPATAIGFSLAIMVMEVVFTEASMTSILACFTGLLLSVFAFVKMAGDLALVTELEKRGDKNGPGDHAR